MKVSGAVPARARASFAAHFRRAYSLGWTWAVARVLARPLHQNDRYYGVSARAKAA